MKISRTSAFLSGIIILTVFSPITAIGNTGAGTTQSLTLSLQLILAIINCDHSDQACLNGGTCAPLREIVSQGIQNSTSTGHVCVCAFGYSGSRCEIKDALRRRCETNVCLNGGTCFSDETIGFRCICSIAFRGRLCELTDIHSKISACVEGTCPFDSTCVDGRCVCKYGFTGTPGRCRRSEPSNTFDPCQSNPCRNDGTCHRNLTIDATDRVSCVCATGFSGEFCQFRQARSSDACSNVVCSLGYRCVSGSGGLYKCVSMAPILHTLPLSDDVSVTVPVTVSRSDIQAPFSFPTLPPFPSIRTNNSELNSCGNDPDARTSRSCSNNGRCVTNDVGGFSCLCLNGWTGLHCETATSNCASNPCLNDGTCLEDSTGYLCQCPVRFIGKHCENAKNICETMRCQNGGTCIDAINLRTSNDVHASCVCPVGFTGPLCQTIIQVPTQGISSTPYPCPDSTPNLCQNGGTCGRGDSDDSTACECPIGFNGRLCENDINECDVDPCKGRNRICVNTFGNYRCDCATGWTGYNCDIQLVGCNASTCGESNTVCRPTFENEKHGHICECSNGFSGPRCSRESTVTFIGNSMIYHLNNAVSTVDSENRNYSTSFRLRTTLSDVIVVEGVDIIPYVVYTIGIREGRIYFRTFTNGPERSEIEIGFHSRIDNGEWYGVELNLNSTTNEIILRNENGATIETFVLPKRPIGNNLPIFTTRFGGLSSTGGKNYFIGCMQDMFVNGQRLEQLDGEVSPSFINVRKGCVRKTQCSISDTNEICGGRKRGRCIDRWNSYSCQCKRPYLSPNCTRALKEATFGHEGNESFVEIIVDRSRRKSTELSLDISMIIRTTTSDSVLAYLGSNSTTNGAYQSFITLEIFAGKLKAIVQLGTDKPEVYFDRAFNAKSKRAISKGQKVNDGKSRFIRLVRMENIIKGYVDDSQVFEGRLNSPFPYPLFIDRLYLGGIPPYAIADIKTQKEDTVNQRIGRLFKGTIQDVRINDAYVPLLKRHMQDLTAIVESSKMFGDPIIHNVLEGTVSDDVCRTKPCQNSGICQVTFNDYNCICTPGWWGKNCTFEDLCVQRKPCTTLGSKCHSLRRSTTQNAYVCMQPVTFDIGSSALFAQKSPEAVHDDGQEDLATEHMQFDIRTRSTSGTIMIIVSEERTKLHKIDDALDHSLNEHETAMLHPQIDHDAPGNLDLNHRPNAERTVRETSENTFNTTTFDPQNYLVLEIHDGGLNLRYARNGVMTHSANITGDVVVNDGQWHAIRIEFETDAVSVIVDEETNRIEHGSNSNHSPLKFLLNTGPVIYTGVVPRRYSNLVDGTGRSFKGCLREVGISKDAWLLFQNQSLPMRDIVSSSRDGQVFFINSSRSVQTSACVSDAVCGIGRKDVCRNGATCEDLWNQHKCHCPFGFEGNSCEKNIDDCPGNKCSNGATCIDGIGNYTCSCVHGYTGVRCETDIDDCSSNPCRNGGTCVDLVGGFQCSCNSNFTGVQCEISILVDCASSPCQHNGACIDVKLPSGQKTFNCSCQPGYVGRACEKEKDFCEKSPCVNGGNCLSRIDLLDYRCTCSPGFTGRNCEENVNECLQKPCFRGQCVDGWGNFTCQCLPGWNGLLCDQDVDECEQTPCGNGGHSRCINAPGSYRCECPEHHFGDNCEILGQCLKDPCVRGNCTQLSATTPYHCECPFGYSGASCETEMNFCDSNPCFNAATCQPFGGGYVCSCAVGFTGLQCETNINECEAKPCSNSGICVDGIGEYTCDCNGTGYGGRNCSNDIDECRIPSMCVHSIGCQNNVGSYNCTCQPDYLGAKCDMQNPCYTNVTHNCQNNGRCVNPRVTMENINGRTLARVAYDCLCDGGYSGEYCQMAKQSGAVGFAGRLEYILGPTAGLLAVIVIIAGILFGVVLRNKRANYGTYSPSRQEVSGARIQMGAMMKVPPEERLI